MPISRRLVTGAFPLLLATVAPVSSLAQSDSTTTPIKHVVVIFDENITFDHYFATYPNAANPPGQPAFICQTEHTLCKRSYRLSSDE